jgi:hypothetical protein
MAIRPYPSEWSIDADIAPIGPIRIRPIRPEDEALYEEFFADVTADDRRLRFFSVGPNLSHRFLARLTQIDYAREKLKLISATRKMRSCKAEFLHPQTTGCKCDSLTTDSKSIAHFVDISSPLAPTVAYLTSMEAAWRCPEPDLQNAFIRRSRHEGLCPARSNRGQVGTIESTERGPSPPGAMPSKREDERLSRILCSRHSDVTS